jgi:hypothetical protein
VLLLVATRPFSIRAVVFPDGTALPSNDPYAYRAPIDHAVEDGDRVALPCRRALLLGAVSLAAYAPGAHFTRLVGRAESAGRVTPTTTAPMPAGPAFEFRRTAAVTDGGFAVTVPYPGRYRVDGRTVRVTEADVRAGTTVRVDDRS